MMKHLTESEQWLPELAGFPLPHGGKGKLFRLVQIDAGRKLTHRLNELGLTPGVSLLVVHDSGGPMILSVRDSRVAIGREMAHKLHVVEIP